MHIYITTVCFPLIVFNQILIKAAQMKNNKMEYVNNYKGGSLLFVLISITNVKPAWPFNVSS